MKEILRTVFLGTAVGAIGLAACDAPPPPSAAVSPSAEPEANAAGKSVADVDRAALEDIVRDKDPYSRARRLGTLLPTLGPEAVPAVKQMLADPGYTFILGATEVNLLVRYWATQRPEEATRWAADGSPLAYRYSSTFTSLFEWAKADPQAAVIASQPWAQRRDVGDAVQTALVFGWFEANDSPELRQYIHHLGPGMAQQQAISAYLRALIRSQGIEAAWRWAAAVPIGDVEFKKIVNRQAAHWFTLTDRATALRWCEAHCDGPFGEDLRQIIAMDWAREDSPAALAWLSSAPEGHPKDFALRVVYSQWADRDREAALAWMKSQTSGEPAPWLRPIFPEYARALGKDSPAEGLAWAQRVVDKDEREFISIQIASAWHARDAAAAEAWLLQSPLSEANREKVRAAQQPQN